MKRGNKDGVELIFEPAPRQHLDWLLPVMLLVSIVFHAFTFYVVQAKYPVASQSPPPSARLTILNPADPEAKAMTDWIESRDPAAIIRDPNPIEPARNLTNVPYQPSYERIEPQLRVLSDNIGLRPLPAIAPPGRVPSPGKEFQSAIAKFVEVSSQLRLTNGLAFSASFHEPFAPPKAGISTPSPAVFLIETDTNGQLQHAFLQHSSGSDALDEYATRWLRQAVFSKLGSAEKWGRVVILWGAEVF